jgi:hypothetical protein
MGETLKKHGGPAAFTALLIAGFALDGGPELELDWITFAYLVTCPFAGYVSGLLTLRFMSTWSPFRRREEE